MLFPLWKDIQIDGILNIDKPMNINSIELIKKIKNKTKKKYLFSNFFLDKKLSGCLLIYFQKSRFRFDSIIKDSYDLVSVIRIENNCKQQNKRIMKYLKGNFYQNNTFNSNQRKIELLNIKFSFIKNASLYRRKLGCFFHLNIDNLGNLKNSLNFTLGLISRKNCSVNEIRRIKIGVITENENLVILQDLIDILWNLNFWKKFLDFQKILIPIPFTLRHLKKIVVKNSAINSLCYGSNLMSYGILVAEGEIQKGQEVVLVTKKKEIIGLGKMCYSTEILCKNYQSKIVLMKKVLMKKNIYPRKWGSGYNSSLKKVVRSIKTL